MKVAIASDHGGFKCKSAIIEHLKSNYEVIDFGTYSEDSVDYPDYALKVSTAVSSHTADLGILICGTGIGMSISANKVKGIRAAVVECPEYAKLARTHNDANILCLSGRFMTFDECIECVDMFLTSEFSHDERHVRRVEKITKIDNSSKLLYNGKVRLVDNPLVRHKLTILRSKDTPTSLFRKTLQEITQLLCYDLTNLIELKEIEIETPLEKTTGYKIDMDNLVIVPILRAGLAFEEPLIDLMPQAKVGHLGMYRDESTKEPVAYFDKMPPNIEKSNVLLVDPMLATGGSINMAIDYLRSKGVSGMIVILILVSAPEGINNVLEHDDNVQIITAAIDRELNDQAYILPGLGDCGDRIFGTE